MVEDRSLDAPLLAAEPLARRAAAGESAAFRAFMAALWDPCLGLVRGSPAMRSATEDDAREVVTRVMARFERDSFRALRLYLDWAPRYPDKTFADWLKISVANVVRDYARERRGGVGGAPNEPSAKRLLNELANSLPLEDYGVRPPVTDAQTARQLLEFARGQLPQQQLAALEAWLQGATHDTIAVDLSLPGAEDAKRLVRAAVAVLRRQFEP
ncbi:MAG: hypothetical protein U0271_22790 [Polyangiaceae bacterium]